MLCKKNTLLNFLLLLSLPLSASVNYSVDKLDRNKYSLSTGTQFSTSTLESESSATSVETSSELTITAQTFSIDYFFNESFTVTASYFFAFILDIDAEVQGFDIGGKYYFLNNGSSKEVSFMGSYIETTPDFSPYVYFGATTRDYQFSTTSLKFQGITLAGGLDYHIFDDYFLNGSLSYQYLLNNNVRTLQSFAGSIGVGYKF